MYYKGCKKEDIEIVKKMPYKEMVQNGWIDDSSKGTDKVIKLRKYFEVAQLSFLQGTLIPGIACRKLSETEKGIYTLSDLQFGEYFSVFNTYESEGAFVIIKSNRSL